MTSEHSPNNQSDIDSVEDNVDFGYLGSRDDTADSRTVASRQRLRDQLSDEIQAFLAKGGTINRVETSVCADPPKRPSSTYGQRPI